MGIFNKIPGSILKSRTETALKAFANDPELEENSRKLAEAGSKLKKSLDKANKTSDDNLRAAGLPTKTAFDDIKF